jgi:hypothetical protein
MSIYIKNRVFHNIEYSIFMIFFIKRRVSYILK